MKKRSRAGWIIGIVFFAIINIIFLIVIIQGLTEEKVVTSYLEDGGLVVQTSEGVEVYVPEYIDIESYDIHVEKSDTDLGYYSTNITAYDVTIDGQDEFNILIKIMLPYDDTKMDSGEDVEDCIFAGYIDDRTDELMPVSYEIDERNNCVIIESNHLTKFIVGITKNSQTRDAQVDSSLITGGMSDLLYGDERILFDNIITTVADGDEVAVTSSVDLAFTRMSQLNSLTGGAAALMQDGLIGSQWAASMAAKNGEWLDDCYDELGAYGNMLIGAQFLLDMSKGDMSTANDNLMKNMAGFLLGKVNSMCGLATFAIDYSLNELGTVLVEDKQIIIDGYNKYYEDYENDQDESFVVRMYPEVYDIYKEHSIMGHFLVNNIRKDVSDLITDYCTKIWKEEYTGYFGNAEMRNFNNAEFQNEISLMAYNEIMESEMKVILARVQKQFVYEAKADALARQKELVEDYGKSYTVDIREANNMNDDTYYYANCFVQFESYDALKQFWAFQLDSTGACSFEFTKSDYFYSQAPTSAKLYRTQQDIIHGNSFETVEFAFNENQSEYSIILGSDVDFTITCSADINNSSVSMGETVWFDAQPSDSGYSYEWNITENTSSYIEHVFTTGGIHDVNCTVFDSQGNAVANLHKSIQVQASTPISLISSQYEVEAGEYILLEIMQNGESYDPTYGVEWDFGDRYIDTGVYSGYEYCYVMPGIFNVTVTEYFNDDDGNRVVVATASTQITVTDPIADSTPYITQAPTQAPTEAPTQKPTQAPTEPPEEVLPIASGLYRYKFEYEEDDVDKIGYNCYEFYDDGTYRTYTLKDGTEFYEMKGTYYTGWYSNCNAKGFIHISAKTYVFSVYESGLSGNNIIIFYNDTNKFEK